jgi:hypothetical protein
MAKIDIDLQKYDGEFKKAGMERVERAAAAIRDEARALITIGKITRVPGRRKYRNKAGHLVESPTPPIWMERTPGGMKKTIRVVKKKQFDNVMQMDVGSGTFWIEGKDVRVYAGNYKTWYATQMEYGRGKWRGGPRSFMRPALKRAEALVRMIIEGGV